MGFNRTAVSTTSREFHPYMVLMQPYPMPATLLFSKAKRHARTMAIREYHYVFLRVVAHKLLHLFSGVVVIARLFPVGEKRHGVPAV